MVHLMSLLFYLLPIGAVAFFITSLVRYLSARKKFRYGTGSVSKEELKKRRLFLIVSSVMMAVLLAVVIGFICLLVTAIAYM